MNSEAAAAAPTATKFCEQVLAKNGDAPAARPGAPNRDRNNGARPAGGQGQPGGSPPAPKGKERGGGKGKSKGKPKGKPKGKAKDGKGGRGSGKKNGDKHYEHRGGPRHQ